MIMVDNKTYETVREIPKRIFYVWGAREAKKRDVLACMQSWRQMCPDYEIIEINEESKKYFDFEGELKRNKWFRTVYQRKLWAYVADYIRIKVLYDNGGIYLDTDVTVIRNFDDFLKYPSFVGMQNEKYVEPAILGSQKGNKLLKRIIQFYDERIWKEPIFTMPEIFSRMFEESYNLKGFPCKEEQVVLNLLDISIFPERIFIPFRYQEEFKPECVAQDTVTIHWFGGSWLTDDALFFLMNKHKIDINQIRKKKNHIKYKILKLFTVLRIEEGGGKKKVFVFGIPVCSYSNKGVRILGVKICSIDRY